MSMSIDECQQPRAGFPKPVPDTPTNVMQQFSMKGKTIVITGAAEGIGGAVADAMAEAGGNVALWYNTNPKAKERAETLAKEHNVQTKTYSVDQTSATAVEAAIKQVVADFGRIDCFVANAGTGDSKPLLDQTLDSYHNLLKVNVDGPVYCAKYAGEVFKKQGFGNLILTSSISAHIVNVPIDQPIYNGTKAFVSHLGKSLAREWREFARVNIVSPGFFDTKMGAGPKVINEGLRMIPLGRQGNVKEIKGLFLYLASDASSYMTGSDCIIDGGTLVPLVRLYSSTNKDPAFSPRIRPCANIRERRQPTRDQKTSHLVVKMPEAEAMAFRFLDLPAELRNRIYELVAINDSGPTKLCLAQKSRSPYVDHASLTKVCEKVRNEYLPMQRKVAHVIVFWDDVNAFTETYLAPVSGKMWPPGHLAISRSLASSEICTSINNGLSWVDDHLSIDVTRIIRARLEQPYFHCRIDGTYIKFDKHGHRYLITQDAIFDFLILHQKSMWIGDIQSGAIAKVSVRYARLTKVYYKKGMEPEGLAAVLEKSPSIPLLNHTAHACHNWGLGEAFLYSGCQGADFHLGII
ncbi:hypothetical protein PTNB85_02755 [Pyrenophora teres f. teres]|nr:hypothetical protein HRS9139_02907 [Pyrenophora teres f. teres]KAE8844490.1 hypothetical protein PTNB85_02755 [Pyrenophora teres f. teres]